MSVEEISKLKRKRGSLKRQLTNLETFLDSITIDTDVECLDLETRLKEKVLPLQNEFKTIQRQLESLTEGDESEEKKNEDEQASFDNRYYLVCGRMKSIIKKGAFTPYVPSSLANSVSCVDTTPGSSFNVTQIQNVESNASESTSQVPNHTNNSRRHVNKPHYPDLKIPTFSGRYDTWLAFYDAFNSMIHSDPDLPDVQKFHYLKGSVSGAASRLIMSLQTTNDNYNVAWEILKSRYDQRKVIVDSHVKAILDLPCMSKEFTIFNLHDEIQFHIRSLRALSVQVDTWDPILVRIIKNKMNPFTLDKWEESSSSIAQPTLKDILEFLDLRSQIEETKNDINQPQYQVPQKGSNHKGGGQPRQGSRFQYPFTGATTAPSSDSKPSPQGSKMSCYLCKGDHAIYICSQFLNLSPQERYEAVRKVSVCPNCLRGHHNTKKCISGGCRKCGKKHNSLLHFDNPGHDNKSSSEGHNQNSTNSAGVSNYQLLIPSQVVLATAIVDALDKGGNSYPCRVMLDGGSQPHVITERFANKLGLKKSSVDIPLGAIDNLSTTVKHMTKATIKSRYNHLECELSLFIVQNIGTTMPSIPIDRTSILIPQDIILADPNFQTPAEVDIILGAQYFYHFLRAGKISIENHPAILQETEFGWIVAGTFNHRREKQSKVYCNYTDFSDLSLLWELKSPGIASSRSLEEEACERHYSKSTVRDKSGRYIVQLPFNEKIHDLGESRHAAIVRFQSLENKFKRDPALKKQYVECIKGYLKEGHMTPLPKEKDAERGFYLPHHAVVKTSSLTTKTRVVFDGSCKSSTGISLNECMMVGPTIQEDLFSIIIRFRTFIYVLTADIEQMYRQIQIHDSHRIFQKIFWRENPEDPIKIYTLNTVTFGTASAPHLAIRTLHQLAEDESKKYPKAATIVKRDFYVDDLLTGANTLEEALALRDDLIELLLKGGFNLRKWGSNEPKLIAKFKTDSRDAHMSLDLTESIKTLGLHWNPSSDTITYITNISDTNQKGTKRSIFSQIAKLFDPLGLLGPIIVTAKLIIQNLWKEQLGWDEVVPSHIQQSWCEYKSQLPLLNHLQFNRCISIQDPVRIELHGFCDASEKAYGACIYFRSTDKEGCHHVALICSKSRVAPLKKITLPKLELCAAILLVNLYQCTFQSMKMKIDQTYFWSDSTITLHWITTPSYSLKTFVANRVAEIQTHTNPCDWRHVPTHDNPADLVSRGQTIHEFFNADIWQQGPTWLSQDEDKWPELKLHTGEIPELKNIPKVISLKMSIMNTSILERYSSLKTLKGVLAYCLRFIHNIRNKERITGPLSQIELNDSELKIIQLTQASTFSREIHDISNKKGVSSKSSLLALNPFLDKGILKVGGRLEYAQIAESQKHPIVLPKNHHVTKLIIREEHIKKMHAGTQATLYGVREKYWPIDGRNTTRLIIRQCVTCFRVKPRGVEYFMGNLPKHRLQPNRPFLNVGVDYCGPFFIKEKRHRNRNKIKAYVSVFVCFATKAVHLELAGDLSTESFLGCLKRFFSRRGKAQTIYSDNATNFLGARNELKELYEFIETTQKSPKITDYLSKESVNWRFIPPRAPHMGGLWEAAVKSFKHHFVRTVGNTLLTHEQLETFMIEIEAILNSRPLTPLSSDPRDLIPLTPGHFLIGSSLTSFPQADLREIPVGRLSSWQHAQQMRQHFWSRWQREYLNQMISRSKWQSNGENIKIGALVVLKEDNLPPMNWSLGRVAEVHPGQDQVVRIVTVRTKSGLYKRDVTRLYPLPVLECKDN